MDIVLIAGLKSGRLIAEYFNNLKNHNLLKVFVMDDRFKDQISDFAFFDDIIPKEKLKKIEHIKNHEYEISKLEPDYIIVVGWSQLISSELISMAKKSCIGFHPGRLPKDRGRSVLAWQISEGYESGCVSMFEIDKGIDSGRIIAQIDYKIEYNETIRDILDKVYLICFNLIKTYLPLLIKNEITPRMQDETLATYRPIRNQSDGIINWNSNNRNIYNLVRAITAPYILASTFINGYQLSVVSVCEKECPIEYINEIPGKVLAIFLNIGFLVKSKDESILITEFKINNQIIENSLIIKYINIGDCFESEVKF